MKKALLFIAVILMSISVFAQTRATFINEHFNGTSLPAGWQVSGSGTSNWGISQTDNAGGTANELRMSWSPQFNGTSRMMMPAVDLTGVTEVYVRFKHALDNYSGSHTIGIATTSDNGTTWNVGWQHSYNTNGAWNVSQAITTPDMGNSSVRFCIFYTGYSYNMNFWYFDDIQIFAQENLDVELSSIDMAKMIGAGNKNIEFTLTNNGLNVVNQVKMSYQVNDNPIVEETFDVDLQSLASSSLSFTEPFSFLPDNYNITVSIEKVNGVDDEDPTNNTLEKSIAVKLGQVQRIPMIEHFSSSTCGPCVSVNQQMQTLTNNNPGKFTYTKYQMNWPGSGDPYYTSEGGTRRQYYNVTAVPMVFLDGKEKSVNQSVLNNEYNMPAFTDVRGSFNVDGSTITVKVDFMSYYELNTAKAFVSVNEKETKQNIGGNGETSFHHIFMKFLTPPTGNAVNIEEGYYQHFEFTQDLSGTHIEEMSDLEVSAWLQIYGTKEMLNSHFLYEYTDIHPYPAQNLAVALEDGVLTATWDAPESDNFTHYNLYINGELVEENYTATEYTYNCNYGFYAFSVEAVYPDDMTSVRIAKGIYYPAPVSVDENQEARYEIYPNPTNGHIVVKGNNINIVEVYNLCGQKMMSVTGTQNMNINMSSLTSGVYMVKIVDNNGNATVNKVVKR